MSRPITLAREHEARATLRETIPEWVRLGCQTDDLVTTGKPYVQIFRGAKRNGSIHLIVMGVHGRSALDAGRSVRRRNTSSVAPRVRCSWVREH